MSAGATLRQMRRAAWSAVLAVLVGASVYEAAVALGAVSLGSLPGDGPRGAGVALAAALLALAAGCGLAASSVQYPEPRASIVPATIAPAAAAFVMTPTIAVLLTSALTSLFVGVGH